MSLSPSPELSDLHATLNGWTLPRWRQLPEVDLYMDQVLLLMENTCGAPPASGWSLPP